MLLIILWINAMFGRTNPKQKISSPGFKRFKRKQKQKYRQPTIPLQMEHRASLSIGVCFLHLVWEPHVQKPEILLSSSGGCKSICRTVAGSSLDSQLAEKIVRCGPSMATVHANFSRKTRTYGDIRDAPISAHMARSPVTWICFLARLWDSVLIIWLGSSQEAPIASWSHGKRVSLCVTIYILRAGSTHFLLWLLCSSRWGIPLVPLRLLPWSDAHGSVHLDVLRFQS